MLSICETVVHCEKNATRLDDNTGSEEKTFKFGVFYPIMLIYKNGGSVTSFMNWIQFWN